MKNIVTYISMLLVLFGCKKAGKFTQFEMDYTETVTIESTSGINTPFSLNTPDVETNSESTFEVNDTRKDLVESIKLLELNMTLLSPDNGDFSFLNEISVYLSADGLQEVEIASKENISNNIGAYLVLNTNEIELKEYLKKEEINIRVRTVTDETIAQDHEIEIYANFFVDAKVIK